MEPYLHTYCVRTDGPEAATACGPHSGTDCAPLAGRSGGGGGTATAARRLSLGREDMTSSPWSVGLPFMLWNSWRLQAPSILVCLGTSGALLRIYRQWRSLPAIPGAPPTFPVLFSPSAAPSSPATTPR